MIARILILLIGVMAANLNPLCAHAQSSWQEQAAAEEWLLDYTVLTMHGDAWGASTEPGINRAIARAIASCKVMSGPELGCGASITTTRAGWSLGIRCGRETIVVADRNLAAAERAAARREAELKAHYGREMPACVRVVTIDPAGRSIASPELARRLAGIH